MIAWKVEHFCACMVVMCVHVYRIYQTRLVDIFPQRPSLQAKPRERQMDLPQKELLGTLDGRDGDKDRGFDFKFLGRASTKTGVRVGRAHQCRSQIGASR